VSVETSSGPRPADQSQRIGVVDVLRGFALLGVVVVNTQAFAPGPPATGLVDQVVTWLVAFLFTAKSYSMFSLLFGLGFAIQMERAAARGQAFESFFRRRCLVLFFFGVAHAVLLFTGDILTMYAVLGLLLLRFRETPPPRLVRWVAGLLVVAGLLSLASAGLTLATEQAGAGEAAVTAAPRAAESVYLTGSYADMVQARLEPALQQGVTQLILAFPNVFPMFLLGLYLGRRRAFADSTAGAPLFRDFRRWGLLLGLPLSAASATLETVAGESNVALYFAGSAIQSVGAPLLMTGYMGTIVLLVWRLRPAGRVLQVLAPLGRLSLTCYLSSSLLLNVVFYGFGGFGLALYGRSGAALELGMALAIYVTLLLFATVYGRFLRYGPAEWLWRTLSYGRRQPLRRLA
jgi:uncharacterized protein